MICEIYTDEKSNFLYLPFPRQKLSCTYCQTDFGLKIPLSEVEYRSINSFSRLPSTLSPTLVSTYLVLSKIRKSDAWHPSRYSTYSSYRPDTAVSINAGLGPIIYMIKVSKSFRQSRQYSPKSWFFGQPRQFGRVRVRLHTHRLALKCSWFVTLAYIINN